MSVALRVSVMRMLGTFCLAGLCFFTACVAHAQPLVLLAASDPAQIAGVEVAKVVAADSSLWLSVTLAGHARLVVVTSAASVERAAAADAWLAALDFVTRVRVSPPPGPLTACSETSGNLADSGLPEPESLAPIQASDVASELELRRTLAAAGVAVDLARLAEFSGQVSAPFHVTSYQASDKGGRTAAVRLTDSGAALAAPGIVTSGRAAVPFTLLTLASTAVLPSTASVSDPSEFAVSYLGASGSTDYVAARGAWLAEDPSRWLLEASASSALFAWTVIPGVGEIEPALAHYFDAAPLRAGRACFTAAEAARARDSRVAADYGCDGADDLARSLAELDFGEIRLTRLFGSIDSPGVELHTSDDPARDPHVVATDFDANACSNGVSASPGTVGSSVPGSASSPSDGSNANGTSMTDSSDDSTTAGDGDSCTVAVFNDSCSGDSSSSSGDSCSGDSSSDSTSSDSCNGDSSSDSTSSDSCSGNSSSDATSSDSCSGDSSSQSNDDSSGCGKSNYDGDTCSGNSSRSAASDRLTSAALAPGPSALGAHRPRRVRLSLFTLLLAALGLPLRRWKPRRALPVP